MEDYIVSFNNGIQGADYCAFQISDLRGNVVAIARTNKIILLELEKIKDNSNVESLLDAIKERFPEIDITGYRDTSLKER